MKKKAQVPNVFPSQSIEDYQVNGPKKVEHFEEGFHQENESRFVLDFMSVKEKYNDLRQDGKTHGEAWRDSNASTLPLEKQILMKQEIEEKNPGFYREEKDNTPLVSKAAQRRIRGGTVWNVIYSKADLDRLEFDDSPIAMKLSECGLSDSVIASVLMKD